MDNKNIKLLYSIIGSFLLVLLKTPPFQKALGFSNTIGIPLLGDVIYFITNLISFLATLLFILLTIKLIINNIKKESN